MVKQSGSEYSLVSIIVSVLLFVAITVFVQFIIQDVTETFIGPKPQFSYQPIISKKLDSGIDTPQVDYSAARKAFDHSTLPYESKKLLLFTSISIPLFVASILLVLSRKRINSSLRIASYSFFISSVVTVFRLLAELASYMYKVNQKMAIYGISLFLIGIFIACIYYIQERHRATT